VEHGSTDQLIPSQVPAHVSNPYIVLNRALNPISQCTFFRN
jgi:hypothetical protein